MQNELRCQCVEFMRSGRSARLQARCKLSLQVIQHKVAAGDDSLGRADWEVPGPSSAPKIGRANVGQCVHDGV